MGALVGALLGGRRMSGRLAPRPLIGNLAVAFATAGVALTGSLSVMVLLAFASGALQSIVLVIAALTGASSVLFALSPGIRAAHAIPAGIELHHPGCLACP